MITFLNRLTNRNDFVIKLTHFNFLNNNPFYVKNCIRGLNKYILVGCLLFETNKIDRTIFWGCISLLLFFPFVGYLFCFRPPTRLFFRLKTISVVSSIRHSVTIPISFLCSRRRYRPQCRAQGGGTEGHVHPPPPPKRPKVPLKTHKKTHTLFMYC